MDGWMDGQMDGWMDRWIDGWIGFTKVTQVTKFTQLQKLNISE